MQENISTLEDFARPPRRRLSIRSQIVFVTALMLILASLIAAIGGFSLTRLQQVTLNNYDVARQINEESLKLSNSFLRAREFEGSLLTHWRTSGYDMGVSSNISGQLIQTRNSLDMLEQLIRASNDTDLRGLQTEIDSIRPLVDDYETTYQVTAAAIRERSRPEGLESQLRNELTQIKLLGSSFDNPTYTQLALEAGLNEQAYYSSGRQEYVDNIRLDINTLIALAQADTTISNVDQAAIIERARSYRILLTQIVPLVQSLEVNAALSTEISADITSIVERISTISNSGLMEASQQLTRTSQQSTLLLVFTAAIALAVGVIASIWLARRIILPLNRLTLAAEALGRGDLQQRVQVTSGSELITLAETFNSMAAQLRQTLTDLEQRVAQRTQDLERRSNQLQAAAEVARDATSTRDVEALLSRAVNLIRDRFGFYHAGIFLIDKKNEYAVLQAATGTAGQGMLKSNHKLKIGETGLVGFAALQGQPRIALNVGADAVHFKNPFLPNTRSEMALPLKVSRQIIGVLDVQSEDENAFGREDMVILQTMADQLAVAIDNARLVREAQENLHEIQTLYASYSQEAWKKLLTSYKTSGYQYDQNGVSPLPETPERPASEDTIPLATLHIPLKVRGQTVASLEIWPKEGEKSIENLPLLQALGDRLSQVLDSARLFEEARANAAREQMLNQIVTRFSRSLDLGTLLRNAAKELGEMPGVSEVSIHLGTPADSGENN